MGNCNDMMLDKTGIESLIAEIRDDTMRLPLGKLLQYAAHKSFVRRATDDGSTLVLRTAEDGVRYAEYLQSIIVTTAPMQSTIPLEEFDEAARRLCEKVRRLQRMVDEFILAWAINEFGTGATPNPELTHVLESQLYYHVRGSRYMCFQRRYYETLLPPMNGLLMSRSDAVQTHSSRVLWRLTPPCRRGCLPPRSDS